MIANYPLWHEYQGKARKHRPKLKGREKADIAIIGGGLTGMSNAYFLSKAGYKVVVLEAHEIGAGATGASSGIFSIGGGGYFWQAERDYGRQRAKALWDLSLYSIKLAEEIVAKEKIKCDWAKQGSLDLAAKPSHTKMLEKEHEARRQVGYSCDFLDARQVKDEIGSSAFHAAIQSPYDRSADPLKFLHGLADAAIKSKAVIHEHSQVKSIYPTSHKVFLRTDLGELDADHVIVGTDSQTYALGMEHDVLPMTSYTAATEPLTEGKMQAIFKEKRQMLWDSYDFYDYFRPTEDNRIVVGNGNIFVGHGHEKPKDFEGQGKAVLQNIKDSSRKIFPELMNVEFTHFWKGTVGFTKNDLPIIGHDQRHKNLLYSMAYSGHGLAMAFLSGKLMLDYMKHGDSRIFNAFRKPGTQGSIIPRAIMQKAVDAYFDYRKFTERL